MMEIHKLAEAKARFSEVVRKAMQGHTIVITKDNRAVAKVVAVRPRRRVPGTGKGIWMARDFDAPLDDFKEYR